MTHTIVLVTGANQSLGLEIVKKLAAEQPNHNILLASRDPTKGSEAAIAITGLADTSVSSIQLAVISNASIASAVSEISASFSKLDVLINNADVSHLGNLFLRSEMLAVFNTNTISAACVTEAFIPLLSKSPVPRVIFVSSDLGSVTKTLDRRGRTTTFRGTSPHSTSAPRPR